MPRRMTFSIALLPMIITTIGGRLLVAVVIVGAGVFCPQTVAEARILRWDIEATVVEIGDPDKIFTGVRLGDPVRGFLSYSASQPPTDGNDFYEVTPFVVAGMVIENPRDDSEIEFTAAPNVLSFVEIINDRNSQSVGRFDAVSASQSMMIPQGFNGVAPAVAVDLYGPATALAGTQLPTMLQLDDWPDATLAFYDIFSYYFGIGDPASYVLAEIHALTPVSAPAIEGDFNSDGSVDAADYIVWRNGLGTDYTQADYVVWRANFGRTSASATAITNLPSVSHSARGSNSAVPEPATLIMMCLGLWPVVTARRRV